MGKVKTKTNSAPIVEESTEGEGFVQEKTSADGPDAKRLNYLMNLIEHLLQTSDFLILEPYFCYKNFRQD